MERCRNAEHRASIRVPSRFEREDGISESIENVAKLLCQTGVYRFRIADVPNAHHLATFRYIFTLVRPYIRENLFLQKSSG